LWIIGKNPIPVNRYQIKKELSESNYVYNIVGNLFPSIFGRKTKPESNNTELTERMHEKLKSSQGNIEVDFLTLSYSEEVNNLIAERQKEAIGVPNLTLSQLFPDVKAALNDNKNWRLSLNFRGFLLFLCGSMELIKKSEKESRIASTNKAKKRIYEVISNPRILEIVPFLLHWREFKDLGFDVTQTLLLLGDEFASQLDHKQWYLDFNSETYLLKKASEIYFNKILSFLFFVIDSDNGLSYLLYSKGDADGLRKIMEISRQYKLSMLSYLKSWSRKEIYGIERLEKSLTIQKTN